MRLQNLKFSSNLVYEYFQTVRDGELKFLKNVHPQHVSHVMCNMSCVAYHVAYVMCHMSCAKFFVYFYFLNIYNILKLVGGGSVINVAD